MHAIMKLGLLVVTSIVYTFLILRRPNAPQTTSKSTIVLHLVIGLAIGVVFLETTRWYVQNTVI